jgi:hypothetical protein
MRTTVAVDFIVARRLDLKKARWGAAGRRDTRIRDTADFYP